MLRENITAAAGPPGVVPGPPAHTQVETFSAAFAPATWDDGRGLGFSRPSAIAAVALDGVDYLYVGDAGNQRIVKCRIK